MQRLLWMKGGGLGDFILGLPVLGALRRHFPGAWVDVVAPSALLPLVEGLGDRLIPLDTREWDGLFGGGVGLPGWLAQVDLAVVLRPDPGGVVAGNLSTAGVGRVLVKSPAPVVGLHQVENLCRVLLPLGIRCDPRPRVWMSGIDPRSGHRSRDLVVVHPGSGGRHKVWPLSRYVRLCRDVSAGGRDVAVVLGPVERERGSGRVFKEAGIETRAPGTLVELAKALSAATVVVGNDSGVSHLAAALGRPSVVLFGPTDPRVWAPRGPHVRVVAASHAGAPGTTMEQIAYRDVLAAVRHVLAVGVT